MKKMPRKKAGQQKETILRVIRVEKNKKRFYCYLKFQSQGFLKGIQIKEHISFLSSKTSLHPNLSGFPTDASAKPFENQKLTFIMPHCKTDILKFQVFQPQNAFQGKSLLCTLVVHSTAGALLANERAIMTLLEFCVAYLSVTTGTKQL